MNMVILLTFLCSLLSLNKAVAGIPEFKRNPVVYGISPLYLSYGHPVPGLVAVKNRLKEISDLGVNIIWLQPITPPFEEDGHGYDVMDYKSVWSELGTPEDLKALVREAHALNIKVMLDMVLNHSSFEHPFVKDIAKKGKASAYYNFYQHASFEGVPYAQHFHERKIGKSTFVYYFWEHLLNFNYDSAELRNYMQDVLKFWVKDFDIDGYRFDASWGPSSRRPVFYKEISTELRKLKPDIILMAEDMAGYPSHFGGTNHPHLKGSDFDWAYDWNNQDTNWISKWSFQTGEDQSETIFNDKNADKASDDFLKSLSYTKDTSGLKPVRYIENNDTPGFLRHHTIDESMFAAKIMFMLPGVPLIFYGQETGNQHELFMLPSFEPSRKMSSYRPALYQFYKKLVATRRASKALSEGTLENIVKAGPGKISFVRRMNDERIKVDLDFNKKTVYLNSQPLL